MPGQAPLPAIVTVAVSAPVAVAAAVAPRRSFGLAFRFFGSFGAHGRVDRGIGRRRFGFFRARFRRTGVVPAAVGATGAPASPLVGPMAVFVPPVFARDQRRLRGGGRFHRGLGRRIGSRRRTWGRARDDRGGGRFRHRSGRRRWGGGLLVNRDWRRRSGGRNGDGAVWRANGSRARDDDRLGRGGLRAGVTSRPPCSSRLPGRGPGAASTPTASLRQTGTAGQLCPRDHRGVANRLPISPEARDGHSGNQRPALVEGQGNHRETHRRGQAEQGKRCASDPHEESVPEDALPQGR